MKASENNHDLGQLLKDTMAPAPQPQFQAWLQRFPTARQCLLQTSMTAAAKQMRSRRYAVKLTIVAAVLVALTVTALQFASPEKTGNFAFAETLASIGQAKAISWKLLLYDKVTGRDGKTEWMEVETVQMAYKHPGLYREVRFNPDGTVRSISVTDAFAMKELSWNPREKTARLTELTSCLCSLLGPFAWVKEKLEGASLELAGRRTVNGREIMVFRDSFRDEGNSKDWSYDFWLDSRAKRIVTIAVPGANIFDPEKSPLKHCPPQKQWHKREPVCYVNTDIEFNAQLDDSFFRLQPPPGYTLTLHKRLQLTEADMVEYLAALAAFNSNQFPDQVSPWSITSAAINDLYNIPRERWTEGQRKYMDLRDKYLRINLNAMPLNQFMTDHAVPGTFRYIGKNVKLGDKGRIVCWYQLKDSLQYRAIYGDLTVADADPVNLPLLNIDP